MHSMRIKVRYFAALRERKGVSEAVVNAPVGVTVSAFYHTEFPPSASLQMTVMFAVNQCYVSADHVLQDGDEVAFVPPLGGG
jgi:molybdopterin converting factor subunit 1